MKIPRKLSALKSFLWRVMGVLILASITYYFTRHWITTTYITFVHHATFLLVYYLHERVWLKLKRPTGKLRNILRALIYEVILGMGIGGLIVYVFTGQWSKVTRITGTYTVVKIITYIIYDKMFKRWEK